MASLIRARVSIGHTAGQEEISLSCSLYSSPTTIATAAAQGYQCGHCHCIMVVTDVLHATMMLLGCVLRISLAEFSATTSKTTIPTARALIAQILTPRVMTGSFASACKAHKKGSEAAMRGRAAEGQWGGGWPISLSST